MTQIRSSDMRSVRVEEMNPDQLVAYVKDSQQALRLGAWSVEGFQERAVFRSHAEALRPADRRAIIKWVFYKHGGKWDGQPVRFVSFSKGRKWWTDMMHLEMQDHLR